MKLGAGSQTVQCPLCGTNTDVEVDASGGDQVFYEDCRACCHPIRLRLEVDHLEQKVLLFVDADDEQFY